MESQRKLAGGMVESEQESSDTPAGKTIGPDVISPMAEEILTELRRITRSIALSSKQFYRQAGLTVPQVLCLKEVARAGGEEVTPAQVARKLHLSPATITGILDRLERDGLMLRERRASDRRKVYLSLTEKAEVTLRHLPPLLQERVIPRLMGLDGERLGEMLDSLRLIVEMIEASSVEASPILMSEEMKRS